MKTKELLCPECKRAISPPMKIYFNKDSHMQRCDHCGEWYVLFVRANIKKYHGKIKEDELAKRGKR